VVKQLPTPAGSESANAQGVPIERETRGGRTVKSDLPFGSEFSPSQIELPVVLELAHQHAGDWKAFEEAVRLRYFEAHTSTNDYNRAKLANNTKLGMIAYGIYDRASSALTDFGKTLFAVRLDDRVLYDTMARHIILHLNGALLIQCVQDMQAAGETVDLVKLRRWLQDRRIHFPRGGKHPSMMRLWLEKADVLAGWRVNEARLGHLLGVTPHDIDALTDMTLQQRTYLRALVNLGGPGPYASNSVERLATATYGVQFNEKSLPKDVLYPLVDLGFIALDRGTKEGGRGAKPFAVHTTEKLAEDILLPLLAQMEIGIRSDLRRHVRKPLAEILSDLKAEGRNARGLALEALAVRLMRLIDLSYVGTRQRGDHTGGAEVDVVFESDRLVFSRWQVQCKNTLRVSVEDVAKEVGITHLLKSNVVAIVSTGHVGQEARRFANFVMRDSNLCVIMIDHDDLKRVADDPTYIVDVLNREASAAMRIKRIDIGRLTGEVLPLEQETE
jgi:hypothetical protein